MVDSFIVKMSTIFRPLRSSIMLRRASTSSTGFSLFAPKNLANIVKLETFVNKSPEQIKDIWRAYQTANINGLLCGSKEPSTASILTQRAKKMPMFVFPVYKSHSTYFVMLSQFQDNVFMVTYLEEFKKDSLNARPWLQLTLYDELVKNKGISLYRADFLPSLSSDDSQYLVDIIFQAYTDDEIFDSLVSTFNQDPQRFNFNNLLTKFKPKNMQFKSEDKD